MTHNDLLTQINEKFEKYLYEIVKPAKFLILYCIGIPLKLFGYTDPKKSKTEPKLHQFNFINTGRHGHE